jgi:hypothetical protein
MINLPLIQVIFIILNIILAKIDANKILAQKQINHTMNALVYIVFLIIAFFIGDYLQLNLLQKMSMILSLLLTRKVVFDISLSLFRGLSWNYTSKSTGSVIDKIENKIFKSGTVKYFFYSSLLLILIILNIL